MERIEKRADELHALGLKFDGEQYHGTWNMIDINVHHIEMTTMNEEDWGKMVSDLKKVIIEHGPSLPVAELPALIGTIEDVPAGTIKNALVKLNITDVELAKIRTLVISAVEKYDGTKASYEAVKRARLDVVPKRTSVKKEAEEGRAEAIQVQKLWIGAEKTVTKFYADLEALCVAKEAEYEAEIKRKADEAEAKEKVRVQALLDRLTPFEWAGNPFEVAQDTPAMFAERLAKAQESFRLIEAGRKAEADRLAREEQERKDAEERNRIEAERLAKIQREQDAAAAKLKADQEAFAKQQQEAREAADCAERERLAKVAADERQARLKAEAETLRLKKEADAKLRAEEDAKQAQLKAEADAKAAEAEKARLAALAPDKEKVKAWAWNIEAEIDDDLPEVQDKELFAAMASTKVQIMDLIHALMALAK